MMMMKAFCFFSGSPFFFRNVSSSESLVLVVIRKVDQEEAIDVFLMRQMTEKSARETEREWEERDSLK